MEKYIQKLWSGDTHWEFVDTKSIVLFSFLNSPNLEMSAKLTTESTRELFVLQKFHFTLFLNWL